MKNIQKRHYCVLGSKGSEKKKTVHEGLICFSMVTGIKKKIQHGLKLIIYTCNAFLGGGQRIFIVKEGSFDTEVV